METDSSIITHTEKSNVTTSAITSRITVLEEVDSDGEYVSTVEDNSRITIATSGPIESLRSCSYTQNVQNRNVNETDEYTFDAESTIMRDMVAAPRRAAFQKLSLVNQTPELTPLLIRVNSLQRARPAHITGTRVSTPIQVAHFIQAKKYIMKPQVVFSLEAPLMCYEVAPSFGKQLAEQQFLHTPTVQTVKVLVLPSKQKVKTGKFPRKTSVPHLLLPPDGPKCAETLQPLWDTTTFTIAYGKHVAVEFNIPQVPTRKVKLYKAEKQKISEVNAAVLYRETPKNSVTVCKASPAHQLRLSTVERQDPQLVKLVRVEQNRWEAVDNGQIYEQEVHTISKSTVTPDNRSSRRK